MNPISAWGQTLTAGSRRPTGFAVRRGPRRSRRTLLLRCGGVLGSLLILAGVVRWALTAPVFGVDRIESGSYRFTSEADLQAAFHEYLGRNIWTLRTADVAARLQQLPWVRDLRVTRRLPHTLEVDFREWSPLLKLATVTVGGRQRDRLMLLPNGGLVDFPTELPLPGLPVLVGVPPVRGGADGSLCVAPQEAAHLLELISAMEDAGLEAACPVDFVVARQSGFAIVLQNKQGTLRVGRKDFEPRLQRYMSARDHLEPGHEYDLRFADRITVRDPH